MPKTENLKYYNAYILVSGKDGDAFKAEVSASSKDKIAQDADACFTISASSFNAGWNQYVLSDSDATTAVFSMSDDETAYLVVYYTTESASELLVLGPFSGALDDNNLYYDTADGYGYCSGWIELEATEPACAHKNTTTINAVEATCIAAGYTGDTICSECKAVVAEGEAIAIDPDNHVALVNGVCDFCGYKAPADYSAVDAALDKVPADFSRDYTAASAAALQKAIDAVVEGKNITEQDEVDAMAQAIEDAINALVKKTGTAWLDTLLEMLDQYLPTLGKVACSAVNATIKMIKDTEALINYLEKLFDIIF